MDYIRAQDASHSCKYPYLTLCLSLLPTQQQASDKFLVLLSLTPWLVVLFLNLFGNMLLSIIDTLMIDRLSTWAPGGYPHMYLPACMAAMPLKQPPSPTNNTAPCLDG